MGYVTMPLYHLLRMNTHDYDLTTMNGLMNACYEMVFKNDILSVIDQEYRDRLALGFALHYFSDELGLETIPLWNMSINEKVINNAEYINSIFEKLDKQVLGDYKVHRGEHASNNQELESILENDRSMEDRTYIYLDNQQRTEESDRQNADTGSLLNSNRHSESGSSGLQSNSHGENENESNNASSNVTNGSDERIGGGFTEIKSDGQQTLNYGENDNNAISAALDTPQGSIVALRTPAQGTPQSLKGQGVDAEINAPFRYLTSGAATDSTAMSRADGQTINSGQTQHINDVQNVSNHSVSNGSGAEKSIGSNDNELEENRVNATAGSQESEQRHANSGSEQEHSVSRHVSDRSDAGTKLAQDDRQHQSEKKGAGSGNDYAVDYQYNDEIVLRSMPYMKKIWNIFDKCFLGTYEIRGMI